MLIANKVDKSTERVVTREMGEKLSNEYDVTYTETSAKTGLNVEFCFNLVQLNDQSNKQTCCSFL
jgi:Ras-related protein Rab-1A